MIHLEKSVLLSFGTLGKGCARKTAPPATHRSPFVLISARVTSSLTLPCNLWKGRIMGFVRKYLSNDGLIKTVQESMRQEIVKPCYSEYSWEGWVLSGLAVFGFKMPSLWAQCLKTFINWPTTRTSSPQITHRWGCISGQLSTLIFTWFVGYALCH